MKKAFTIIELIFVIILIGIMSAVVVTSFKTSDDNLALAAHQVVNHIRYTQHLAITQQKFDPKDTTFKANPGYVATNEGMYYRSRWQIRFVNQPNGAPPIVGYSIYTDMDREGNIDMTTHQEAAINPSDGLRFNTFVSAKNTPDVNLNTKYEIANIVFSGNCQAAGFTKVQNDVGAIVFDEKGRPYYGIPDANSNDPYQYRLTADCTITLTGGDGRTATITVTPETGYTQITAIN